MARYSPAKAGQARQIAAYFAPIASRIQSAADRRTAHYAVDACQKMQQWADDTTEASRRLVLRNAGIIADRASDPEREFSPLAPAFATFAEALEAFTIATNFDLAVKLAAQAATLATLAG